MTNNGVSNDTRTRPNRPGWQSCEQVGRDLGALYNIVFIFWWLVFTCMLYPCAVQLKEHYQKMSRRKAGFKLDFKFLVIFLVLISCGARTLWLIDPHPNSTPFGFHIWRRSYGGQMWVHLLLKTSQIGITSCVLAFAVIWRKLVNDAKTMRRAKKGGGNLNTFIGANIVLLTLIIPPIHVVGTLLGLKSLDILGSYILMVYVVILCITAVWYTFYLSNELKQMKGAAGKAVISRIRRTVYAISTGGGLTVLGVVFLTLGWSKSCGEDYINCADCPKPDNAENSWKNFIFIMCVHFGEAAACCGFYYALQTERKEEKLRDAKLAMTEATTQGTNNSEMTSVVASIESVQDSDLEEAEENITSR